MRSSAISDWTTASRRKFSEGPLQRALTETKVDRSSSHQEEIQSEQRYGHKSYQRELEDALVKADVLSEIRGVGTCPAAPRLPDN
jgi:hypothetical protein